jgi:hypothetical protein
VTSNGTFPASRGAVLSLKKLQRLPISLRVKPLSVLKVATVNKVEQLDKKKKPPLEKAEVLFSLQFLA